MLFQNDRLFEVDPWKIIERRFSGDHSEYAESVFSLANEYMGTPISRDTSSSDSPPNNLGTTANLRPADQRWAAGNAPPGVTVAPPVALRAPSGAPPTSPIPSLCLLSIDTV